MASVTISGTVQERVFDNTTNEFRLGDPLPNMTVDIKDELAGITFNGAARTSADGKYRAQVNLRADGGRMYFSVTATGAGFRGGLRNCSRQQASSVSSVNVVASRF